MADNSLPAGFSLDPPKQAQPKGLDAIRGYFKDKGNFLNPHAADALAATSFSETGGDPYAINKTSKAAGAYQWLGQRKKDFLATGDTTPEGQAKYAMSELPKYKRSWAALNDPNVSADDLKKTLIDEFEAPGGSAAQGYGPAAGDLKRARAYVPPGEEVKVSPLPAAKKPAPQGLPAGFSAQPPTSKLPPSSSKLPPGFSSQAPGRQDPSIVANTKQPEDDSYFAPEKKVAKMMMADPKGTLGKLGHGVVQMGKSALNDLAVFGDVAQGKASMTDPATQARVMGAAGLTTGIQDEGLHPVGKAEKAALEAKPEAKAAEVAPELKKAVGDGLTPAAQPSRPVTPTPESPQSAGAAATPLHEIAAQNTKDFEAATKAPGYKEQAVAGAKYAKGFFDDAESAKATIQKNLGNMNRMGAQAKEAMVPFTKFTRSLTPEEGIDMFEWLETPGQKRAKGLELSPEAHGFANTFKDWMQNYRKKIASIPGHEQQAFVDDFVTHLYKDSGDAQKAIADYGAKQGSAYFTKGRVFKTYADAIRSGKPLQTTDPMEVFSRYIENASKKVASWETISDAKEAGNLVYRKPENAPQGWVPLKGVRDGFGHDAYAPPGWASVYNNHTSRPASMTIPGTHIDVLGTLQTAANRTTGLKLTLSGFHPALATMEAVFSGMANGITKAKNGRPVAGLAEFAKAPFRPLTSYQAGRAAQRGFTDGEFGDATYQKLIQGLTDANYDFMRDRGLADEYRTSRLPGFIKGWQQGIPANAGGMLKTAGRAFDTIMEPTFQYYVPWLKNQAAMARMKTWLEAHPNASREELATYGRQVEMEQSHRMGEMNKDNLFMNATAKKMAQTAMLSYSFAIGQARNVLGAAYDASRVPDRAYRALKGTKPEMEEIWTDRMSYAIAIGLGTALVNSMYQYFFGSGDAPQSLSDLVTPRTGGTDPSTNKPERAVLPNFANAYKNVWEGGIGHEAYDKLAPLWQTLDQLAENKDFKSQPIRDPNDTVMTQLKQMGEFAGSNALPISIGSIGEAKEGSHINTLERMFGIRAAGRRDTDPENMQKIISYKDAEAWYEKRKSDINAKRARQGLGPVRVNHRQRTLLIDKYMKDPESDPLQTYGGTQ